MLCFQFQQILVASLSKVRVCGFSLAGIMVSNPAEVMEVYVCCECCLLLGTGHYDDLPTRLEEFNICGSVHHAL